MQTTNLLNIPLASKLSQISLVSCFIMISCTNPSVKEETTLAKGSTEAVVEAISFGGKELYQRQADSASLTRYLELINDLNTEENLSEEGFMEKGHHYAAIYQFNNAILAYSEGLEKFPDSYKLLRHRAHRFLSTRKVEEALVDLERALSLISAADSSDLEYYSDGGIKGTYEYWIYYHLGLAHYLNGNYEEAVKAYQKCMVTSVTGRNKAGAIDWLYHSFHKSGNRESAEGLINGVRVDSTFDLDYAYTKRILMYQGKLRPDELLNTEKPSHQWSGREITFAYGIGSWLKYQGEQAKGEELHRKILDSPYWNSWAFVVADRELSPDE